MAVPVSFLIKLQAESLQLYHKGTLAQVLSCKFCKFFRNFVKHLQTAASVYCQVKISMEKSLPLITGLLLIQFNYFRITNKRNDLIKNLK